MLGLLPGIGLFMAVFLVILLLTKPLGVYMARVFTGERTFLTPVLGPIERLTYRICGVDPAVEQGWVRYSVGALPTHGGLFVGLLAGTIFIVGALTFFPALALGPIVDQLLLGAGRTF